MTPGIRRRLAAGATLALLYFLSGKFGLSLAYVHRSVTAVWPPTGVALFGILVFGYRVWPAIFAGAFLVNLTTSGSIPTSLGIALGNTLEGLAGAYLVTRFANGRNAFNHYQSVFKYAFLAVPVSTMVSATIGVSSLCLGGLADWTQFKTIWLTWWFGDAGGDLIVAPLLILWSAETPLPRTWDRIFERLLVVICTFVVGAIAFGIFPGLHFPMAFLSFPVLAWSAFRFATYEATIGTFILSVLATWGTLHGYGQFAIYPPEESLLVLQAFLGTATLMTLAISALVSQRRRDEEELRGARDELEKRVRERTSELSQANESLRELSARLLDTQNNERRRLARELHDSTAQILAASKMSLELAREQTSEPRSNTAKTLTGVLELTDQALREVRTLAFLLYPPTLDNAGLSFTIPSYAEGFARRSGVRVAVTVPNGLGRLPNDVEVVLFHVVQESLTNIHRHSKSPTAEVRLEANSSHITLEIRDEGRGIPQDDLKKKEELGVGIRDMRQTLGMLGGRLDVVPGNPGTIIRAVLPVPGHE